MDTTSLVLGNLKNYVPNYAPVTTEGKQIAAMIRLYIATFNSKVKPIAQRSLEAALENGPKPPPNKPEDDAVRKQIAQMENAVAEEARQYKINLQRSKLAIKIATYPHRQIEGSSITSFVLTARRLIQIENPGVYLDVMTYLGAEYFFNPEARDAILMLVNTIRGALPQAALRIYEPGAVTGWRGATTGFLIQGIAAIVTWRKGARLAQLSKMPGVTRSQAAEQGLPHMEKSVLERIGEGTKGFLTSIRKWNIRGSRPNTQAEEALIDQATARHPDHELRPNGTPDDNGFDVSAERMRALEIETPTPSQAKNAQDDLVEAMQKQQAQVEQAMKQGGAKLDGSKTRMLAFWGARMGRASFNVVAYQGLGQAVYRQLYGYSLGKNELEKVDPAIYFEVIKGRALFDLADRSAHYFSAMRARYSRFFDAYERPSLSAIAQVAKNERFWKEVDFDIQRMAKIKQEFEHFRQYATEYDQERELFLDGEEMKRPDLALYTRETKEQFVRAYKFIYARQGQLKNKILNQNAKIREMRASSRDEYKATTSLEEIRYTLHYVDTTLKSLKASNAAAQLLQKDPELKELFAP